MSLNFCPKCGEKLEIQSNKCAHCGFNLSERILNEQTIAIFADFTTRALAWFIDMIIVLVIVVPLSIYVNFGYFYIYSNVYLFIIGFFYFFMLEYFNSGKTVGKRLVGIRSVDTKNFQKGKLTQYFLNNVTKANPFILIDIIFGVIMNYSSEKNPKNYLRITQNLSEICVIKLKK